MPEQRRDDTLLSTHIVEEMQRYADIEKRLSQIEDKLDGINEVWNQAKGALVFIKVLASITAAIAAIYVFVSSNLTILPK